MKMEAAHFSEILLTTYQITLDHIPDYFRPNLHHCVTPEFNTVALLFLKYMALQVKRTKICEQEYNIC
jgi:hypothetical protein